jgi:flagellar protein FliT
MPTWPIAGYKRMDTAPVIANYERLLALTGQMREAAIADEWDLLAGIEQKCRELVADMKMADARIMLDEAASQYKKQLINKILADDTEVRIRVQAWMSQLELSMQSNRQEQRLLQAYGA